MHFGEYELSPGLIGLSLLHTAHRKAFQRLLVRPSNGFYPGFSLATRRSPGFASIPSNCPPFETRFRFGSGTLCLSLAEQDNS